MFTLDRIEKIVSGTWLRKEAFPGPLKGGAFDTRTLKNQQIFFAWKGENSDGHEFLSQLDSRVVKLAVVERENKLPPAGVSALKVKSSLAALHALAARQAESFPGKIVAVTGSSGKTTVKNWLARVLREKYRVLSPEGSFNNHIGCPITLLSADENHHVAVLEMGTSGAGEIDLLASIAKPHYSAVVNAGAAHVGKIGSVEKVKRAKMEIFNHMRKPAAAFVPANQPDLAPNSKGVKIIRFGRGSKGYSWKEKLLDAELGLREFAFQLKDGPLRFSTELIGHHVGHALSLVIAAAVELGLDGDQIKSGLKKLENLPGRGKLVRGKRSSVIIDDTYNANPDSLLNMLRTMEGIPKTRKIAVIGDLAEQDENLSACREILTGNIPESVGHFMLTGPSSPDLKEILLAAGVRADRVRISENHFGLIESLNPMLGPDCLVAVKGSRSSKMENVAAALAATP